ncbi:MAG: DUF4149 domain-containing protein [Vicinamibacterales bacterium]
MVVIRFLHSLALAVWLGGIAVLGAVVAPATFQVLQANDAARGRVLAGAVFGTVLDRFQIVAYVCAAVVLVTLAAMARVTTRRSDVLVRGAIAAAMLAITLFMGVRLYPEVDRVQATIGAGVSPSTLEAGDPRRIRFDTLHARSTRLMQLNLVGTLILLAWHARSASQARG